MPLQSTLCVCHVRRDAVITSSQKREQQNKTEEKEEKRRERRKDIKWEARKGTHPESEPRPYDLSYVLLFVFPLPTISHTSLPLFCFLSFVFFSLCFIILFPCLARNGHKCNYARCFFRGRVSSVITCLSFWFLNSILNGRHNLRKVHYIMSLPLTISNS